MFGRRHWTFSKSFAANRKKTAALCLSAPLVLGKACWSCCSRFIWHCANRSVSCCCES
ncbi:hypothetical protein PR003_g6113 [Phytophthora rubi]|uniref:Uncharacterized protein n=1 Tax=Phytophthora rubi TaxID=129364 RepID=A0A6A3KGT7_9STRA|nr:hypothetical protein PR002_g17185 [Phytophthora rubi]KAE9043731.1 hypothetical protein PR001_g5676 [Phytophthora rubi]KAE9349030.1 hypothetical protein PR003_g6113 [Phytophthora rubi]